RAKREKVYAKRAQAGLDALLAGNLPTSKQAGALAFEGGEFVEQGLFDIGHAVKSGSPTAGMGPTIGGDSLGSYPGDILGGFVEFGGAGVGAALEFPVTATTDLTEPGLGTRTDQTPTEQAGGFGNLLATGGGRFAESAVKHPGETAVIIAGPALFSGLRGVEVGRANIGKTTPYRPTAELFNVGESQGVSVGLKRYAGKIEETRPIVSAGRGVAGRSPFELGTPDVPLETTFANGRVPSELSALETNILARSLRNAGSEAEATRLTALRDTITQTQQSPLQPEEITPAIGKVLEEHGITAEAAPAVTDLLKSEEAKIIGSITQPVSAEQVGEPGLNRIPRDLDVHDVASKELFSQRATETINRIAGEKVVRLEEGTPTSIKSGEKLFDIKEAGAESGGESGGSSGVEFGIRHEPDVFTKEGVRTTTLSHQTTRKGIGSIERITPEPRTMGGFDVGRIGPEHAGRIKDIPDFYIGEKANIKALRLLGKESAASKAETSLDQFTESFGSDMSNYVTREYAAAKGEPQPVELFDFGKQSGGVSPSPSPAAA
ncbi:MAG: hypothetical protein ACNS61_06410, partial [Candidatus Wenzhouxiangella sp. M2_3B_020]